MGKKRMALDCETNGVDLYHGCRPFYVTICYDNDEPFHYEWDVDPKSRWPDIPKEDVVEIQSLIDDADEIIGQNLRFDIKMLSSIGINRWDYSKCHDTLMAGHLLASNQPHDLTSMVLQYLGIRIEHFEDDLEKAVQDCRRKVRSVKNKEFEGWIIASEGWEMLPSAGGEIWRADYWLPRAYARKRKLPKTHSYWRVLSDYADTDSQTTMALWKVMEKLLHEKKLWKIYLERMKLLQITNELEDHGVTLSRPRLEQSQRDYLEESQRLGNLCVGIAKTYDYDLVMPKSGISHSLNNFVFDVMKVPVQKLTEKGNPCLNASAMEGYLNTLNSKSKPYLFLKSLSSKRKRDTAYIYMEGYKRFWRSISEDNTWYRLHPSFNPTSTHTLRWSSSSPNAQNVCLDGSTEILTYDGWIRIDHIKNGEVVAQYDPLTKDISFVECELHTPHYKGDMLHITTEQQIDMLLTPNHRCLIKHKKTHKLSDVCAKDFMEDYLHFNAGIFNGGGTEYSQDLVTWLCAVQADGSYVKVKGDLFGIKFVFKKGRKIERLRKCLDSLGVIYTEKSKDSKTYFYVGKNQNVVVMAKTLMPDKCFGSWLLGCTRSTLDLFYNEVFFWDGDYTRRASYTSSIKKNADWIQILFCLSGSRAMLATRMPNSAWSKSEHHYVNIVHNKDCCMTTNFTSKPIPWDDKVYCVTVPTSYIVIRRNGKVSVTGNSKKQDFNLRYSYGPIEGREWWCLDYSNLEITIPAMEVGEQLVIDVLTKPNDPPFYGSYHLMNASIIYPDLFWPLADTKGAFKEKYASTWYQWGKNFSFASIYGGGEETCDAAAHKIGAYRAMRAKLSKIAKLNDDCIAKANKLGYVETIPDKTVDPDRGYPIYCTMTDRGNALSTVPLNFHIQSSAMWCTMKAMIRCSKYLREVSERERKPHYMTMQVHDEIVFDLPYKPNKGNLPMVKKLKHLMEQSGDDIGIPLKVSVTYCPVSWSEGQSIK